MYICDMKNIIGYEDLYTIDKNGNIYSIKDKKNISHINGGDGYYRVYLKKNGIGKMPLLHRLIAIHFIDNPEHKPCVNHINGIKSDNRVCNLEWVSYSENLIHAYKNKLNKKPRPVEAIDKDGVIAFRFASARDAERHGFSNQNIYHCCSGHRKTHLGYQWRYSDV